jgi:hypothetical protein
LVSCIPESRRIQHSVELARAHAVARQAPPPQKSPMGGRNREGGVAPENRPVIIPCMERCLEAQLALLPLV